MTEYNEVDKAYKKLKSSIFFDKTQLPLRNKLVLFEDESAEKKLSTLWTALQAEEDSWNAYERDVLDSITTTPPSQPSAVPLSWNEVPQSP